MAGLCEGGNEPPGSLKASNTIDVHTSERNKQQLKDGGTLHECITDDLIRQLIRSLPQAGNHAPVTIRASISFPSSCLLGSSLLKLRRALREKHPRKKILQHDNAWPHTDRVTVEKIRTFGWETLPQSPYSSDLAPSEYHLFSSVKEQLRGQRYETLEDIRKAVRQCLREDETNF
ncbi:hypothetical protein ANN_02735 [Periplaneta americana]|uniref:Uncharacterized protein n=1 Tax=Periplaneta americana TaxID=6978 RepID=A0ABQ8TX42_PERAM|nr:hypothetical protein ANN_02735 [Periplaneta americana]